MGPFRWSARVFATNQYSPNQQKCELIAIYYGEAIKCTRHLNPQPDNAYITLCEINMSEKLPSCFRIARRFLIYKFIWLRVRALAKHRILITRAITRQLACATGVPCIFNDMALGVPPRVVFDMRTQRVAFDMISIKRAAIINWLDRYL